MSDSFKEQVLATVAAFIILGALVLLILYFHGFFKLKEFCQEHGYETYEFPPRCIHRTFIYDRVDIEYGPKLEYIDGKWWISE